MPPISPVASTWLNLAMALVGATQGTDLVHILPAGSSGGWILTGIGVLNTVLHALSAPKPGPLVTK